jgi:argininosuccinate synthase
MKKVVLAYSGGLDTSFCAKYLSVDKKMEVYSVIVNTGGFDTDELVEIEEKAYELGVKNHKTIDITGEYYTKCIKYLVFGNVLKNNTYPLSVSSERTFQAIAIAEYAKEIGAEYIAHGSTGAGNDQVRFDYVFNILVPEINIITPIRELLLSRDQEIDYLKKSGVIDNWATKSYSINKGLWGTSIGGKETLTSNKSLPEEAYTNKFIDQEEKEIILGFEKGEIHSLNGTVLKDKVNLIKRIDEIASSYAIGRDMHIGDTILGTKGRVAFEAAAPMLIIKAHHALEKHTLTKWQLHWKEQLANWYGMFLHESQYLEPVMRNIEKFLVDSQKSVNGEVILTLAPYRFSVAGINSPNDLMQSDVCEYGEVNKAWKADDVKGFTKILANSLSIYSNVNKMEY